MDFITILHQALPKLWHFGSYKAVCSASSKTYFSPEIINKGVLMSTLLNGMDAL